MKDEREIMEYFSKADLREDYSISPFAQGNIRTDVDGDTGRWPQFNMAILNLNLPKVNGMDVLRFLKKNLSYCRIPVIIFSENSDPEAIAEAYKNGANGFISKPASFKEYIKNKRLLKEFMLNVNTSNVSADQLDN